MKNTLLSLSVFPLFLLCNENTAKVDIPAPKNSAYAGDILEPTEEDYYDKVLGALVGSAIGDAMGASTEMWYHNDIQLK